MDCCAELIYYCRPPTGYCPLLTARRSLLLLIRDAKGARGARVADEAGEDDDGQHVGDDLDELRRYLLAAEADALELDGDGLREAEEEAGEHRLDGAPLAEDERRQRDEAAPRAHVAREERRLADGEVRAAYPGQRARQEHGRVAHAVD